MWFRRPLGEMTSEWDLGARSDNGEEHVRTVEDGKNLSQRVIVEMSGKHVRCVNEDIRQGTCTSPRYMGNLVNR